MAAPGFFILLAGFLLLLFAACMVTGAVWLFFGWRKQSRSVQFLSALPFGVGLLIIGPLLLLALIMVGLWLIADWRTIPPTQEQTKPNQAASGNGAVAFSLHAAHVRRTVPEQIRACLASGTAARRQQE
jgi:hypothetical protein